MKTFIKINVDDVIELICLMQILTILSFVFFFEWVFSKLGARAYLWFLVNVSIRIEDSRYMVFLTKYGWK
ncbi:hypothetical protein P9VFCI_073 [Rhizobium phage P9VFCI]|uniref:Uncharacterized protein n=2 Tax=Innesvirus TaxID=3044739 RepID=A0A7G7WXQ9_9CAUD|nr:hypothetical protein PP937_gp073 [Rhizobium phage P9VFCI]YP_010662399.1 hypothetical protein PP938_gp249 [Rhizobium phage AF3]QNH71585.1 hypothetical protein AF3_249 [Rhizobium phage AF3]QNH72003.1 hypothetical protein P9VFCI_073 [Rhizobium phage P9VFCI]